MRAEGLSCNEAPSFVGVGLIEADPKPEIGGKMDSCAVVHSLVFLFMGGICLSL